MIRFKNERYNICVILSKQDVMSNEVFVKIKFINNLESIDTNRYK
jgi:hypothetical protein